MAFLNKNKEIILLSVMLLIAILVGIFKQVKFNKEVEGLKKTIIAKDSLFKVREGEYTKLVNDMKTGSELNKEVKNDLPKTYQDIKKSKEKIINNTKIVAVPKIITTVDTVYVDAIGEQYFTSYYPKRDSAFITHKSIIKNRQSTNTWEFQPLKINVVVTQQKDGMYRARFVGPSWLEANEVQVNSLPMSPVTESKFKFMLGGSGGYSFKDKGIVVGAYTGIRYKNKIVLIHGGTNKVVSVGYIQEF